MCVSLSQSTDSHFSICPKIDGFWESFLGAVAPAFLVTQEAEIGTLQIKKKS
jgi:hypothetical protein